MKQLVALLLAATVVSVVTPSHAQSAQPVACGDVVAGTFDGRLEHLYEIDLLSGTNLIVYAEHLPIDPFGSQPTLAMRADNGSIVDTTTFAPDATYPTVETGELLREGTYTIRVGVPEQAAYQLFISCVERSGQVITANNIVQSIQCGQEIDNPVIRTDELQRYYIPLNAGDTLTLIAESLEGEFSDLTLDVGFYAPDNRELDRVNPEFRDALKTLDTGPVPITGVYRIYVRTYDLDMGTLRISASCTLADGTLLTASRDARRTLTATVLDAGDFSAQSAPSQAEAQTAPADAISVPLALGNISSGAIAGDYPGALSYEIDALGGAGLEVSVNHMGGTLPLSVMVIDPDGGTLAEGVVGPNSGLVNQFRPQTSGVHTVLISVFDSPTNTSAEAGVFAISVIETR